MVLGGSAIKNTIISVLPYLPSDQDNTRIEPLPLIRRQLNPPNLVLDEKRIKHVAYY
jgi:hypothetical protein